MDVKQMTENILEAYHKADVYDREAGVKWYPWALGFCRSEAHKHDLPVEKVVGMCAALSPRTRWEVNVYATQVTLEHIQAGIKDAYFIPGKTFKKNITRALNVYDYGPEWLNDRMKDGLKVKNFYANILGDEQAVTVDEWARRIAIGDLGAKSVTIPPKQYHLYVRAYREAAKILGLPPRTVQATTWVWARRVIREKVTARQLPLFA
jgi:hypothetical protein